MAGKRNGIPCEDPPTSPPCGKDAKAMTAAIVQAPFFSANKDSVQNHSVTGLTLRSLWIKELVLAGMRAGKGVDCGALGNK
jgi:hypothetical protein